MNLRNNRLAACVLLIALTAAAYHGALRNGFVAFDDGLYVVENTRVQSGLSWPNVAWAFTTFEAVNWHPLTWLSLMLDFQLFGMAPWGYHMTNLLLHMFSVCLLFLWLNQATKAWGRSLFAALLFAIHPIHVESVAWIAERKDVLSVLFANLTFFLYVRYCRKPSATAYVAVFIALFLGLMAKPMLVTVPCAMLLLDFWPLERLRLESPEVSRRAARLIAEKIPLLALSILSSAVTILAQRQGGMLSLERLSMGARLKNASVSYVMYLAKTFWPTHLAAFYPHPKDSLYLSWSLFCLAIILVITGWAVLNLKKRPYWTTGWLWYLGMLLPVIGIMQIGLQAMADRYAYLPMIGIYIIVSWQLFALTERLPGTKVIRPIGVSTLAGILVLVTSAQVGYWHDTLTLFDHAVKVTKDNYLAHYNVGCHWLAQKDFARAEEAFRMTVSIDPENVEGYVNLGMALNSLGKNEEARTEFERARSLRPNHVTALSNLAVFAMNEGNLREAERLLMAAATADPKAYNVYYNLGLLSLKLNDRAKAEKAFRETCGLKPDYAPAYYQHARALLSLGRIDEALMALRQCLQLDPDQTEARRLLSGELIRRGLWTEVVQELTWLLEKGLANKADLLNLGIALASSGRLPEAEATLRKALEVDPQDETVRFNLANALLMQDKSEEAAAAFSKYLQAKPDDVEARYRCGLALAQLGKNPEAAVQFNEALRIDPNRKDAREELAKLGHVTP